MANIREASTQPSNELKNNALKWRKNALNQLEEFVPSNFIITYLAISGVLQSFTGDGFYIVLGSIASIAILGFFVYMEAFDSSNSKKRSVLVCMAFVLWAVCLPGGLFTRFASELYFFVAIAPFLFSAVLGYHFGKNGDKS